MTFDFIKNLLYYEYQSNNLEKGQNYNNFHFMTETPTTRQSAK